MLPDNWCGLKPVQVWSVCILLANQRAMIRIIAKTKVWYGLWFGPIFSYKQSHGGSYHGSYKLVKERFFRSPTS